MLFQMPYLVEGVVVVVAVLVVIQPVVVELEVVEDVSYKQKTLPTKA